MSHLGSRGTSKAAHRRRPHGHTGDGALLPLMPHAGQAAREAVARKLVDPVGTAALKVITHGAISTCRLCSRVWCTSWWRRPALFWVPVLAGARKGTLGRTRGASGLSKAASTTQSDTSQKRLVGTASPRHGHGGPSLCGRARSCDKARWTTAKEWLVRHVGAFACLAPARANVAERSACAVWPFDTFACDTSSEERPQRQRSTCVCARACGMSPQKSCALPLVLARKRLNATTSFLRRAAGGLCAGALRKRSATDIRRQRGLSGCASGAYSSMCSCTN